MTEEEILALAQLSAEEDNNFVSEVYDQYAETESEAEASSSSSNSSSSGSDSDSDSSSSSGSSSSDSDDLAQIGFAEDDILELAQVSAQPEVKMVPQVHVQVTRIGADGKVYN